MSPVTPIIVPGVFVEETSPAAQSIRGVPTDVTGFVGATAFGPIEQTPILLTSLADYERHHDPFQPGAPLHFAPEGEAPNHLWHAARAFFAEGGKHLYVSRAFSPLPGDDGRARVDAAQTGRIRVSARHPGATGNQRVRFRQEANPSRPPERPTLTVELISRDGSRTFCAWPRLEIAPRRDSSPALPSLFEVFAESTSEQSSPEQSVATRPPLGEPPLVITWAGAPATVSPEAVCQDLFGIAWPGSASHGISAEFDLQGGNDGQRPGAAAHAGLDTPPEAPPRGLRQLEGLQDIAIVAAPGSTWHYAAFATEAIGIQRHLVAHAEHMRYRLALLDSGEDLSIDEVRAQRRHVDSRHAALHFPWVTVADPLTQGHIKLPPSAFVAGICARTDTERGVHKAPANEVIRLAIGLEVRLSDAQQELLLPEGINALRDFGERGIRVWGARTLSSDPEARQISVRRLLMYLQRSIEQGTQWSVFEANEEPLWTRFRLSIDGFLHAHWRAGALVGDRPEQAYFVRCDRSTMSPTDIDEGRLIGLVGVAPLKPGEFVVFRVGQHTARAAAAK